MSHVHPMDWVSLLPISQTKKLRLREFLHLDMSTDFSDFLSHSEMSRKSRKKDFSRGISHL